jgi:hypothetical protein
MLPAHGASGWLLLLALALAGLAIPSSRHLSRRIVNVIVALSGIAPLLWWIPMPHPHLRTGILAGIVVGILAGCIVSWTSSRRVWRDFWPDWNAVDAYPLLAGVAAIASFWNFLIPKSAAGSISLLVLSWDFAPHFNMYAMLRRYATVIPLAPLPDDGSTWTAATYPQGLHALMATIADVVTGTGFLGNDAETLLFLRLVGVVGVISAMLVVASLTSIPSLRHQPLVTLPFAALVSSAWIVGPGSIPMFDGFPNFALGVAVCVAVLSVMRLQHQSSPIRIAVLFAMAIVSIAHNWILLLALCIPAAIAIVNYQVRRILRSAWPVRFSWGAAALAALAGVGLAAWQLKQLGPAEVLTTPGGITQPDWGLGLTFMFICAAAFTMILREWSRSDHAHRTLTSGLLATAGSALFTGLAAAGFGAWQLMTTNHLSYYFYKFGLAALMMAVAATGIACAEILVPRLSRWASTRQASVPVAFVTLGALSLFGWPTPALAQAGLVSTAPGARAHATQNAVLASTEASPGPIAQRLLAVSHSPEKSPFIYVGYLEGLDPILGAQWSLTLRGGWTEANQQAIPYLAPLYRGPSHVPEAIEGVLAHLPDLKVAVDQNLVPELRAAFPRYSERILGV